MLPGCNGRSKRKPDPSKGAVSGVVLCGDTGKPARFAQVILTAIQEKDEKAKRGEPNPESEETVTDLEGRFRIEAVPPGRYYAFATLEGYLDPRVGVDMKLVRTKSSPDAQAQEAMEQWKGHMVEVTVAVHRTTDTVLTVERGAAIEGNVSFDDGSPAIGMRFDLERKTPKGEWTDVGLRLMEEWTLPRMSDGHGHFALTNLPAGEYRVCAMIPADDEDSSPRVCLGDTFRKKASKSVKIAAGETLAGVDIVIPLDKLHRVEGIVSVTADGHAPDKAKVELLFADDRQKALETDIDRDGSFAFDYVPEDKYVVRVAHAEDVEDKTTSPVRKAHVYGTREVPVQVLGDVAGVQVSLPELDAAQTVTPQ
jgi:hypothetical protein